MAAAAKLAAKLLLVSFLDATHGLLLSLSHRQPLVGRSVICMNAPVEGDGIAPALNVIGTTLQCCCADVGGSGIGTGFYRDGHCSTGPQDEGRHTVCMVATAEFLAFSASVGNDLSTPIPEYRISHRQSITPPPIFAHASSLAHCKPAHWLQFPPAAEFPGVKPGDCWCLCATRWVQALQAGKAPKLKLLATHEKTLSIVRPEDRETLLAALKMYAVDSEEAEAALERLDEARSKLENLL